jgi:hypothetical protein
MAKWWETTVGVTKKGLEEEDGNRGRQNIVFEEREMKSMLSCRGRLFGKQSTPLKICYFLFSDHIF